MTTPLPSPSFCASCGYKWCHYECLDCGACKGEPIDYADDSGYSYDHKCKEEDVA